MLILYVGVKNYKHLLILKQKIGIFKIFEKSEYFFLYTWSNNKNKKSDIFIP